MEYQIVETCYGPDVRFNDWKVIEGRKERAGGMAHIYANPKARLQRDSYPYGGGGDVEIVIKFSFDRLDPAGRLTVHINDRKRTETPEGFRISLDGERITAFLRDEQVGQCATGTIDRRRAFTLKLATLAESYAIWIDDKTLASGRMPPPFTDNEGDLFIELNQGHMRLISFTENFIAADIDPPSWQRRELLYEEKFGERSFAENWICNKGEPGSGVEIGDGAFIFRHMSNSFVNRRFDGPIAVDCVATPVPTKEKSAGITDAIFIWMIDNPGGDFPAFIAKLKNASLANLKPLPFYWVDFGGSNNVTTRMRKNPHRHMIRQFTDRARLLERDRTYRITVVQMDHFVEFWVDGKRWIATRDPNPLTSGYVGFRAYNADLKIERLRIWRIGPPMSIRKE